MDAKEWREKRMMRDEAVKKELNSDYFFLGARMNEEGKLVECRSNINRWRLFLMKRNPL